MFLITGWLAVGDTYARAAADTSGPMQRFPPPADQVVGKANVFTLANLRWALSSARLLAPTDNFGHASKPMPLSVREAPNLDSLSVMIGSETLTLNNYLRETHTDGFIAVHCGRAH